MKCFGVQTDIHWLKKDLISLGKLIFWNKLTFKLLFFSSFWNVSECMISYIKVRLISLKHIFKIQFSALRIHFFIFCRPIWFSQCSTSLSKQLRHLINRFVKIILIFLFIWRNFFANLSMWNSVHCSILSQINIVKKLHVSLLCIELVCRHNCSYTIGNIITVLALFLKL